MNTWKYFLGAMLIASPLAASAADGAYREPVRDAPAKTNASQEATPANRDELAARVMGEEASASGGSNVVRPGVRGQRVTVVPGAAPTPVPAPPAALPPSYPIRPEIWTTKSDFNIGETIEFFFSTNKDAYVYIFNRDSTGHVTQLLPNYWDQANRVRAGQAYKIPTYNPDNYHFKVTEPAGVESVTILAVAERYEALEPCHNYTPQEIFVEDSPSPFDMLADFEISWSASFSMNVSASGSASGAAVVRPNARGQRVSVVPGAAPTPVPVAPPAPQPTYEFGAAALTFESHLPMGQLSLQTRPAGAYVLIDGHHMGNSPVQAQMAPGEYEIVVQRQGFWTEVRTVTITADQRADVQMNLRRRGGYGAGPAQGYPAQPAGYDHSHAHNETGY